MGAASRIPPPVFIDSEPSLVLARSPDLDRQQRCSVEQRPYRRALTDEELMQDAYSGGSDYVTCLVAGNRVLLADGAQRPIEQVEAGDCVMTLTGPRLVEATEATTLGLTRRVVELRGLGDQALLLSNDHPVWVARTGKDGARKEWWGTYNIHHVLYEMHRCTGFELAELPFVLQYDLPEQVAHVSGWLHVRPIFHDLPASTVLHHLVVAGGCSFIAEGFPVFSHCRDEQGPASPWRGLHEGAEAAQALRRLVPEVIV